MPIGYWGSCLGDHSRHKSMVETSVISCESCLHLTCASGTVGEINIVITCMEWHITGPFICSLPRSLYVQYKLDNIYVTINNICTTKTMNHSCSLSIKLVQNCQDEGWCSIL